MLSIGKGLETARAHLRCTGSITRVFPQLACSGNCFNMSRAYWALLLVEELPISFVTSSLYHQSQGKLCSMWVLPWHFQCSPDVSHEAC